MPIDLTRSILVVLIPGAVATIPSLLWLVLYTNATLGYASKFEVLANALVFVIVAIAGITCETVGTHIEARWDKQRETSHRVSVNWYAYLAHRLNPEPAGYRYVSRLATMLYFELSMFVATFPFSAGVGTLLYFKFSEQRYFLALMMLVGTFALLRYFYWNAKTTHEVLCKTRQELNIRIDSSNATIYK